MNINGSRFTKKLSTTNYVFELSLVVNQTLDTLGKQGINIEHGASNVDFIRLLKDGILHPQLNPGVTLETVDNYFFVDNVLPLKLQLKLLVQN